MGSRARTAAIAIVSALVLSASSCSDTDLGLLSGLAPTQSYHEGLVAGEKYARTHPTGWPATVTRAPTDEDAADEEAYNNVLSGAGADIDRSIAWATLDGKRAERDRQFKDGFVKAVKEYRARKAPGAVDRD